MVRTLDFTLIDNAELKMMQISLLHSISLGDLMAADALALVDAEICRRSEVK